MTSSPSKPHMRLAWAALAARAPKEGGAGEVAHERLLALIEGRVDEAERDRLFAQLARDPDLWNAWRRLQALVDEAPKAEAPEPRRTLLQRLRDWLGGALVLPMPGPRFALVGTAALVLGLGFGFSSWYPGSGRMQGLSPMAMAWVADAADLRGAAALNWSPPRAASALVGRRSALQVEPTEQERAFEAGFRAGRVLTLSALTMQVPTPAPDAETSACESEGCDQAKQLGVNYGAWATLTAVRCATGLGAVAGMDSSALEAERSSVASRGWVPFDFPWIEDSMGRTPCEVADAMHLKFPELPAGP